MTYSLGTTIRNIQIHRIRASGTSAFLSYMKDEKYLMNVRCHEFKCLGDVHSKCVSVNEILRWINWNYAPQWKGNPGKSKSEESDLTNLKNEGKIIVGKATQ
ncbi:unnamed protein product [Trichobilharzia regenti]|nr:unnamed protein product [Trichobilharzia regenti]